MNLQEARQEALDEFDFDKAAKVYLLLDWRLAGCDGVPTAAYLRELATSLLRDLSKPCDSMRCGGLRAVLEMDGDSCYVALEFIAMQSVSDEIDCTLVPVC